MIRGYWTSILLLAYLLVAWSRCPNWCNNKGLCVRDDDGGYCYCDMGYTGEDCSLKVCPSAFDPVRPIMLEENPNRRQVRLETSVLSGQMSGAIFFTFGGDTVPLNANAAQLDSNQCTYLLSGLKSVSEIDCQRELFDPATLTGRYLITLRAYPERAYTNNIVTHDGNPGMELFACNSSQVSVIEAQGAYCEVLD
eukprot:gene39258-47777_t